MPDQNTGDPASRPVPAADAPLVEAKPAADGPSARGWRRPGRLAAIVSGVAVLAAAGAVIPLRLTGARAASSAIGGVFSRPTVRFAFTLDQPKTKDLEVLVTLASRSGGSLAQAHGCLLDIAVLRHSRTLVEVRETGEGLYLRMSSGLGRKLMAGFYTSRHGFLPRGPLAGRRGLDGVGRLLESGRWVGLRWTAIEPLLQRLEHRIRARSKLKGAVPKEVSRIATSLGRAWDELVSLHQVESSGGTTEYSASLPLRSFLHSTIERLVVKPSPIPGLRAVIRLLILKVAAVPNSLELPIDLWVSNGSLVKISVTGSHTTLVVAIDHPSAPTTPSHVAYLELRQVRRLLRRALVSQLSGSAGVSALSPPFYRPAGISTHGLERYSAFLALGSFSRAKSFAELVDHASPDSLYALSASSPGPRVIWKSNGPSTAPWQVSVHVGPGGLYAVLLSARPKARTCAGYLLVSPMEKGPVLGANRNPLAPILFTEKMPSSGCNAATVTHLRAGSRWVGYAPLSNSSSRSSASSRSN